MGFIRRLFENIFFKRELTPKGECFYKYVFDQYDNKEVDEIEDYEDTILEIRDLMEEHLGIEATKRDAIEFLVAYYDETY